MFCLAGGLTAPECPMRCGIVRGWPGGRLLGHFLDTLPLDFFFFSIVVFCQTASLGNFVLLTHSRILNNSESYCK